MSSLTLDLDVCEDISRGTHMLLCGSKGTYPGPSTTPYGKKWADPNPFEGVCEICVEFRELALPTRLCTHAPIACAPCLGEFIAHAVWEGSTSLVCPAIGCTEELGHGEIVQYLGEDVENLARYNTLKAQRELERDPNFIWCTNPVCGQGQMHTEKDPIVTCDYCHARSCFLHRVPWHEGLTCEQYVADQEDANEAYMMEYTKRCPACRIPIEKDSGCEHMTCRCGHQFCWDCLAEYFGGSVDHDPGCLHRMITAWNQGAQTIIRVPTPTPRSCFPPSPSILAPLVLEAPPSPEQSSSIVHLRVLSSSASENCLQVRVSSGNTGG
ncbi:hypothetical protein OPQ81_000778 [Rhizoctonia solani]|nr:hypothetical protein OPQ81_000778 [Rhizoctonia solani]